MMEKLSLTADGLLMAVARPATLGVESTGSTQCPDIFAGENVQTYARSGHFCRPAEAESGLLKKQLPTGRKFAKKIFIQFPTGRKLSKNSLDIS
jgi:hypothetical protein